jgi:hypothetical protein
MARSRRRASTVEVGAGDAGDLDFSRHRASLLAMILKRALVLLVACGVLSPGFVTAAECTHDVAVQRMAILQSVVDGGAAGGFPTMPETPVYPGTGDTWVPIDDGRWPTANWIETLPDDALTRMEKNVLAVRHSNDAVHMALNGQCGDPLTAPERAKAQALVGQFDPWISAWEKSLPAERTRRATDKADAATICGLMQELQAAQVRIAKEKANPGGVVDLNALHTDGQMVQAYTAIIASRKPLFARDRKKPFSPAMCGK